MIESTVYMSREHGWDKALPVLYCRMSWIDFHSTSKNITCFSFKNLSQFFNCRRGRACAWHEITLVTKQSNLKLKTQPEQLLGSFSLGFLLPIKAHSLLCEGIGVYDREYSIHVERVWSRLNTGITALHTKLTRFY